MLEGSYTGDFSPSFCPTLFLSTRRACILPLSFSFLLYWCGGYPVACTRAHSCAKSRGKEDCLPYLCSQQGIMLFFCPGSKPRTAGWVSQDGSSIQGLGICPLPTVWMCECVQPWLFMPAHFICFAVGNHRLPRGRISPHCSLTIAAIMELWLLFYPPCLSLMPVFSFFSSVKIFSLLFISFSPSINL